MRQLNLVFLAVLVVGLALFGGGMHLVHGFQMRRNASALLVRAERAEAEKQLDKAEEALKWYLSLRPDDGPTWARYARVVNERDPGRRRIEHVFMVQEQALRHVPEDPELKRRCVDLAMELGRFGDARPMLDELLAAVPDDGPKAIEGPAGAEGRPPKAAVQRAELEDLMGQCERGLGRHEDAEKWFLAAIKHDPGRVDAYDRLARLRHTELRRNDRAAETIQDMIARNPGSGRAHVRRWQFAREFAPPAAAADLAKALELAPNDREVLIAAAMDSEEKRDTATMRAYLEKGHGLDPKDELFALGLARLEAREGRLDRAEAVLRSAFEARPIVTLAFELANVLVLQGKIDGKDGAAPLMAQLRRAGAGETLVRFLEAESLAQQKRWAEAVPALETARAVLGAAPDLVLRTNLMLAECHGRLGAKEQRLDALRRAAQSEAGGDAARPALAEALARSGRLDQAISALSPMTSAAGGPEWRIDMARLLLQKALRQPRDRRDWSAVERAVNEAEKALSASAEPVILLRLDVLAAQGRLEEARKLLDQSLAKGPRNLGYRLASARLAQRQGRNDEALQIINQAEKDLGPDPRIDLARLDHWGLRGGAPAVAALEKLAEKRGQVPAADRPAYLDQLASVAIQLGRLDRARQYGRELAELQPENVAVRLRQFDLAVMAGDRDEPARLVAEIRAIEGDDGTNWRFARAVLLLDQARRSSAVNLDEARAMAAEITERNPGSWIGPSLSGEIAELAGSTDEAIDHYFRALELGDARPSFARRLVLLLDQKGRRADVERVAQTLRDQGAAWAEITLVQALDAIHKRDYDHSITLARRIYSESSSSSADHLNLGRFYLAAGRGDEAGKEFRRAVELGRGAPENWLAYVEYLTRAKRPDEAKAAIEAAGQALSADQAAPTLVRCALLVGDGARAEALARQALEAKGKADDVAALRLAIEVALRLNHLDAARSYLERVAGSPSATPADRAWANRTNAALLLATGRLTDRERALALIDRNLTEGPENVDDQTLKATILALWPARRGEAIAILERLAGTNRSSDSPGSVAGSGLKLAKANRLGADQRFLLAQFYLGQGAEAKYQDQMQKLLAAQPRDPRHLAHYVNHAIDLKQFAPADHWLAELKKADPKGRPALELEARLLDARKRRPELLALLEARAHEVPDDVGAVADLLNHYGFAKEAEAAYRTFIAREPRQPERSLALARFLASQDRVPEAMEILKKAWTACRPDQVAAAALSLYGAPSAQDAEKRQIEAWVAEAVQKDPKADLLASKLGVIHIQQGRFDEAEALLRRILADHPDNADALNGLAWLLALRDQSKAGEALKLIEHAIVVQGPAPSLVDTRAVAHIRANQLDQAVRDLTEVRKLDPKNPSPILHLAWAYQTMGRKDEARKAFRQAGELGWTAARSDPLERQFMERLRQDLGLATD